MSRREPFDFRFARNARRAAVLLAVALTAAPVVPASAAKIYRCGNAFQDQPCPETKLADARLVDRSAAGKEAAPCTPSGKEPGGHGDCVKSGNDTQRDLGASARR